MSPEFPDGQQVVTVRLSNRDVVLSLCRNGDFEVGESRGIAVRRFRASDPSILCPTAIVVDAVGKSRIRVKAEGDVIFDSNACYPVSVRHPPFRPFLNG